MQVFREVVRRVAVLVSRRWEIGELVVESRGVEVRGERSVVMAGVCDDGAVSASSMAASMAELSFAFARVRRR